MPWSDGILVALIVRVAPETRAAVEDHRAWLAERKPGPVSLAEAARDLLERGFRTCKRFRQTGGPHQLALFEQAGRQADEARRHG